MGNKYKCKHCGQVVKRESNKQKLKSYCTEKDKMVYITKIETQNHDRRKNNKSN